MGVQMTPQGKPISYIAERVAESFGMTLDELISDDRYEPVRSVRAIAIRVIWNTIRPHQTRIATVFKRDRSTISASLDKTRDTENKWMIRKIDELVEQMARELALPSCPQEIEKTAVQDDAVSA